MQYICCPDLKYEEASVCDKEMIILSSLNGTPILSAN